MKAFYAVVAGSIWCLLLILTVEITRIVQMLEKCQ